MTRLMGAAERPLILASGSTTRLAMLTAAGLVAEAVAPAVDEAEVKQALRADGANAATVAEHLAELKARRVARRHPEALVVGADQMLVAGEVWFDKPPDLDHARAQLRALRGRSHELVTAAVVMAGDARLWHHVARARLTMRAFSDGFLEAYVEAAGSRLLESVGAYQLEGLGAQLFARIEGDVFTILGLPLLPLLDFLRAQGVAAD